MSLSLVLVNPNFQPGVRRIAQTTVGPPLGLAYLAAAARAAGHRVRIIDANALGLDLATTIRQAQAHAPHVLGITATTPTIPLAGQLAAAAKAASPELVTVVGGPHSSFLPERTLREFPSIDIVARGEGELLLPRLLQAIEDGSPLAELTGVAFRDSDGAVVDTGQTPTPQDLDALLPPARDLLPMECYRCTDSDTFTTILATRGCPCSCVYCAVPTMFGKGMRYRSPEAVVDEMEQVNRRWGVDFFSFLDDTFTTRHDWVYRFCDRLRERRLHERIRWICLTRPDLVERHLLRTMRRAGCVRVELSVESGSQIGRSFLRKGMTTEAVVRGFQAARDAGLSTMGFAILNIPGETEQDVETTFELVRRVDPDYLQVSFMTPYPGTALWDIAEEEGWVTTYDWSRYSFLNHVILANDKVSPEQLQEIYLRFVRRFYLRPGTAIKLGKLIASGTAQVRPLARTVGLGLTAALLGKLAPSPESEQED